MRRDGRQHTCSNLSPHTWLPRHNPKLDIVLACGHEAVHDDDGLVGASWRRASTLLIVALHQIVDAIVDAAPTAADAYPCAPVPVDGAVPREALPPELALAQPSSGGERMESQ